MDLMKQMSRAEVLGTMRGVEEIGVECVLSLFFAGGRLFNHAQLLAHFNEGCDAFVEVLGFVAG